MIRRSAFTFMLLAPLAAVACNKGSGEGASGAASASATVSAGDAEAKTIFEQRCTPCHGASGKGDGSAAAALNPKPRDYTNADWQKSVTDDDLRKVIVKGGKAVGKSELMPPNADLEGKPAVVDGLVKIVRAFGKK
jgi:mono/diheme cytochrome c family protein